MEIYSRATSQVYGFVVLFFAWFSLFASLFLSTGITSFSLLTGIIIARLILLTGLGSTFLFITDRKKRDTLFFLSLLVLFVSNYLIELLQDIPYYHIELLLLLLTISIYSHLKVFLFYFCINIIFFILLYFLGPKTSDIKFNVFITLVGGTLGLYTHLNRKHLKKLLNRIEVKQVEQNKELEQQIEFENIISEISASVIYLPASELDWTIDLILETVGSYEKVERCYVFTYEDHKDHLALTYHWSLENSVLGLKSGDRFELSSFPYIEQQIQSGQMIIAVKPSDFPKQLRKELDQITGNDINSMLMAPLFYSNRVTGFFGFDSSQIREEGWSERTMNLINVIGQIIMTAIERKRSANVIQMNDIRFSELARSIKQVFFLANRDFSSMIYISPPFENIWEIPTKSIYHDPYVWKERIHPADKEQLNFVLKEDVLAGESFDIECRLLFDKGRIKWIRMSAFPVADDEDTVYRYSGIIEDITEEKSISLRLAEARSYESDVSARIQQTLLLTTIDSQLEGVDLDVMSIPSQSVDGDFFDFYRMNDHILDFVLADVMGKGIAAALTGAAAKNSFNRSRLDLSIAHSGIPKPEDIVSKTDLYVSKELIDIGKFLTLYYVRIDSKRHSLDFVDCGHTSIIHYCGQSQSCWIIKGVNMPMGFTVGQEYKQFRLPLRKGDMYFLYSDGISEAVNSEGELFGEERLIHIIRSHADKSATEIAQLVKDLSFSYAYEGFKDDVTCIAFKPLWEDNTEYWNRSFPYSSESIRDIRDFSQEFLDDILKDLINDDNKAAIILAINEAVANIMEHSKPKDTSFGIQMEMGLEEDWFFIRMTYIGDEFNWLDYPEPDVTTYQDSGYGLHLIQTIMDSAIYYPGEKGQYRICLSKNLRQD
ncbi:SpoIIE family protein phosphatase [Spirochaeta cellobiosiphila]|uniref:SpoIIE family protein phosphatase n=1 Tax=Spirochaeta cellobiosiphila TaxID=504483 RepID=UPI00048F690F|nr:SpoIIE family protein phosphatase [Spirochaeta cellobiosiphila]